MKDKRSSLKKAAFALLGGMPALLFFLGLGVVGPPLSALSGSAAEAAVKYVTPSGAGAKDGASWSNAFGEEEFPAAIQSATAGDEFWVAAGAYRPSTTTDANATFTLKNGVAIYGGFSGTETARTSRNPSTNVTVLTGDLANDDTGKVNGVTLTADQIQGTNSKTVVTADNSITDATVLDGVTVTAGNNTGGTGGGMVTGGGSPTITGCTFAGNKAVSGGGMATSGGSPTVTNCTFSGNTATDDAGGGMVNTGTGTSTVTDCTFSENTALNGGGMVNGGGTTPNIGNCTFSNNSAANGGGMYNYSNSSPTVTNCTFSGNTATNYGGGMVNMNNGTSAVTGCTFSGNTATNNGGGGVFNNDRTSSFTNCTFANNSAGEGGGICNFSATTSLVNCTLAGNTATNGKGLHNMGGIVTATNCILWNVSGGEISTGGGPTPIVTYSVVRGGYASGTNIISADPNLGPLADNGGTTRTCAISADSSAVDAGTGTGAPATDQRGVPRPQGAGVDMGAYEHTFDKFLSITVSGDGTVSRNPAGTALTSGNTWEYAAGTGVTLSAAAESWYFVAWSGDASGTNPVTTVTMSGDKHVTASFAKAWTITASADANGAIAPAGNVFVLPGTNQIFTVTPNAGYAVADVTVDGVSVGAATTYTFPNVSADHTIQATFTAAPTATPTPPDPTATPTATPTSDPTPSPFPSPDPSIPLPEVTLTLTLLSGGEILAGPVEITDPGALEEVLSSLALLAQLVDFDPDAVAAGAFNMNLVRFFSILARLDPGVTELVLLLEVTMGAVEEGYTGVVFLLARTFDDQGNPTGYTVLPREEGASVFRRSATTETWRVAVADGGATDGAPEAGRVLPHLAAVVAVVRGEVPTGGPTGTGGGGGGGCDTGAGDGGENGSFGGVLSVLLLLAVPTALLLRH